MFKRRILITAGPTWIKIDEIRIITNIFTGQTGLALARQFKRRNSDVKLIINPSSLKETIPPRIKIKFFYYFDELEKRIKEEIKTEQYDMIIHSAAVSDYRLEKKFKGKIPSKKKELILKLVPTKKIIKVIREKARETFLVQFKLEIKREGLIEKAYNSLRENRSDLVVANAWEDLKARYRAFIIDKEKKIKEVDSIESLTEELILSFKERRIF